MRIQTAVLAPSSSCCISDRNTATSGAMMFKARRSPPLTRIHLLIPKPSPKCCGYLWLVFQVLKCQVYEKFKYRQVHHKGEETSLRTKHYVSRLTKHNCYIHTTCCYQFWAANISNDKSKIRKITYADQSFVVHIYQQQLCDYIYKP